MYDELLEAMGITDWEGDDVSVTCPDHGNRIEPDAEACPDGCKNPIREAGMI